MTIPLDTLPPGSSDLFSAFDHVVRAAQPDAPDKEWHLEWAEYHFKRYRNTVGSHRGHAGLAPSSDEERATWNALEKMIKNVGASQT